MSKKKIFIKKIFYVLIIFSFIVLSNSAFAETAAQKQFNSGMNKTASESGYTSVKTPSVIIGIIIKAALSFLGVIFLILMIYGGYKWMIARGNEQDVTKAKDIIQNAIIGLIVVLAAYGITAFIGAQIAGSTAAPG